MTSAERLKKVLSGGIPDCVPVAPDISNMVPARMTGKPFWDVYLYQNPPIWKAYIDAVNHFGFDSLMDGYVDIEFNDPDSQEEIKEYTNYIVFQNDNRIVTQKAFVENGKLNWIPTVDVYYVDNPPTRGVDPSKIGLPYIHQGYFSTCPPVSSQQSPVTYTKKLLHCKYP